MIRRVAFTGLLSLSIILSLACMISHWHSMHMSNVTSLRHWQVTMRGGGAWYYGEANRHDWQSSDLTGYWSKSSGNGLLGVGSDSDGRRDLWILGLSVRWWYQDGGYRRYYVSADFFKMALVSATYPAICVFIAGIVRVRRRRRGQCIRCGYDLTGNTTGVCPECATRRAPAEPEPKSTD